MGVLKPQILHSWWHHFPRSSSSSSDSREDSGYQDDDVFGSGSDGRDSSDNGRHSNSRPSVSNQSPRNTPLLKRRESNLRSNTAFRGGQSMSKTEVFTLTQGQGSKRASVSHPEDVLKAMVGFIFLETSLMIGWRKNPETMKCCPLYSLSCLCLSMYPRTR